MPDTRKVLALDLSANLGHATLANGLLSFGHVKFSRHPGNKSREPDHPGVIAMQFEKWLTEKVLTDKPEAIAYENVYRWMSADAAKAYGLFRGIVLLVAAKHCIGLSDYSPSDIKKTWTGKGNANKDDMMRETRRRYALASCVTSDESDALAIINLHLNRTDPLRFQK